MIEGEKITIIASDTLKEIRLNAIIGYTGIIKQCIISKRNPGAIVHLLKHKYLGESDWFIPLASLETASQAERKKRFKLINSTKI